MKENSKGIKVLFLFEANPHNVWMGLLDFLDREFNLQVAMIGEEKKLNLKNKGLDFSYAYNNLDSILKNLRPDIVLVYHIFSIPSLKILLKCCINRIPVIVLESMHYVPLEWMRKPRGITRFLFPFVQPFITLFYNSLSKISKTRMICMTKRSYDFMSNMGFKNITYSFLPYYFFYTSSVKKDYQSKKFRLLYVGRFTEMKNLELVFSVLKQLKEEFKINQTNFEFNIIGVAESEPCLRSVIRQFNLSDIISIVSFVPHLQLQEYYTSHDLFILPSYDVLGSVTLEAIENMIPVLIADTSGFSSLIPKNLIFKQNNPLDLKNKLLWCINNKKSLPSIGKTLFKSLKREDKMGRVKLKNQIYAIVNLSKQ